MQVLYTLNLSRARDSGVHPEIFKGRGYFSKTIQYPIVINLFLPLAIVVKQGFAVIDAFRYNICLLRTPVLAI